MDTIKQTKVTRVPGVHESYESAPQTAVGLSNYLFMKRLTDIVVSMLLLVLFSPVFVLIALLIALDSRGPIIFTQKRVGCRLIRKNETIQKKLCVFSFYKFRTMYQKTDESIHRDYMSAYINNDQDRMSSLQPTKIIKPKLFKLNGDKRITRIGHFLRKSSLDELPQFWNILKGNMSLVGPRPAIPYEVEMYTPWHRQRLYAQPGLTGLWQVTARNSSTFEEMVKLDIEYVESQNFWLDIKILFKTPLAVLSGKCD
jgi:lipopolysaccharide/colanic/teichoic acid biosynthesis glycosyltransferase